MQLADFEAVLKGRFIQQETDDGDPIPAKVLGLLQLMPDSSGRQQVLAATEDLAGIVRVQNLDWGGTFYTTAEACQRAIDGEPDDGAAELPDAA